MADTNYDLKGREFTPDPMDVQQNKAISILCYFGILFLIPYFMRKDSQYVRFHSNQGLVLLIADVAINLVLNVLKTLVKGSLLAIPVGLVSWIIGLALFALMIIGIVFAVTGKMRELPIIGGIRILK